MSSEVLPILYSFRRCPYAIRARLALSISGQRCELREVVLKNRPAELYAASGKGTVPVLILPDGKVIDESLHIMKWALSNHDPENWILAQTSDGEKLHQLIAQCDGEFKHNLDRYKYATRYEGAIAEKHRQAGAEFISQLEQKLADSAFFGGIRPCLADMAIAPFIRQFSSADRNWFELQAWPNIHRWLNDFIGSDLFLGIMDKHPAWSGSPEQEKIYL